MFLEFPKTSANKVSLCIYPSAFKLRVYRKSYMVFLLTLWDSCEAPLIWWCKNHIRKEWGSAFRVSAQHRVQRIGLLSRISKWFGTIANR